MGGESGIHRAERVEAVKNAFLFAILALAPLPPTHCAPPAFLVVRVTQADNNLRSVAPPPARPAARVGARRGGNDLSKVTVCSNRAPTQPQQRPAAPDGGGSERTRHAFPARVPSPSPSWLQCWRCPHALDGWPPPNVLAQATLRRDADGAAPQGRVPLPAVPRGVACPCLLEQKQGIP